MSCREQLLESLKNLTEIETSTYKYTGDFNVKKIKRFYDKLDELKEMFPTACVNVWCQVEFKFGFINKTWFEFSKISYRKGKEGKLELKAISYDNVSSVIQCLLYIKEKNENNDVRMPLTVSFLKESIGDGFSEGQLIDYIDREYDKYKHTNLPALTYRYIFKIFGFYAEMIGNNAFDLYMETRNTHKAWQKSMSYFMVDKLNLEISLADKIADQIMAY